MNEKAGDLPDAMKRLRADLPNFPQEVVDNWLASFIGDLGWPPGPDNRMDPEQRWPRILGRTVEWWAGCRWRKDGREINEFTLDPGTYRRVCELLVDTFAGGSNGYQDLGNSNERIMRQIAYLKRTGTFSSPLVAVEKHGLLDILDGYHRLTALFCIRGWKPPIAALPRHAVWIASGT